MAGDKFNIKVSSWYKTSGSSPGTPTNPLSDLLAALINGVSSISGGKYTATELNANNVFTPSVTDFLTNRSYATSKPKAYLSWVLFDEQFKLVSSSSGAEQVGDDQEFKVHVKTNLPVSKNGYLYVYVSNETPNIPVYFDNLQVTHTRGPLLEETHYYPFGLTMAGISSKAAGTIQNKEKTFQGQRFDDDLRLNWVQFKWRNHDPQIGRFIEIDPLADKYVYNSTYAFSENKVTGHVELEGLESSPLPNFFKALQDEFIAFGRQIDRMLSFSHSNDKPVSTKKSKGSEVTKSIERKTTSTLNFGLGNWMSYVAHTNSNAGAPSLKMGIDKKTEVFDKTTTKSQVAGLEVVGTESISRTDGTLTTSITVSGPVKLGVIPNANLGFGWSLNGNGTTTTSANLSGSGTLNNTIYTAGTNVSLTGQSGNKTNTQFGFSIYGQSSSGKEVNTVTFKILW